jgi:hypothetical protein
MRYALHHRENSTELRFRTLKELWTHVRAESLCVDVTDIDDVNRARRSLDSAVRDERVRHRWRRPGRGRRAAARQRMKDS